MNYRLEYQCISGRDHRTTSVNIPADSTPVQELEAFFSILDTEHIPYREMSPGRYAFSLEHANQVWAVKVVTIGDDEDTQEMEAIS